MKHANHKPIQCEQNIDSLHYQHGKESLPQHIIWNDSYSVGNKELDEHHKRLFSILNEACDACAHGNFKAFSLILDKLLDYVLYHFEAEENYMKSIKYPEIEAHQIEHQQFTEKLIGYHRMVLDNNEFYSLKLVDLTITTYEWLCEHILIKDLQFRCTSF